MLTLQQACAVLARVHTVDDDNLGYLVEKMAPFALDSQEYIEAWGVIRQVARGEPVGVDLGTSIGVVGG